MALSRALSLAAAALLAFPATTLGADVPGAPAASLRPVTVTAGEAEISALVTPVPVIETDAVTRQATVRVDNTSRLPEIIHLEVVDYVVDRDGKPGPAPEGYALGSAAWYHLDETDFVLPSGMSVDVGLTATPPATAAAGDHSAALNVRVRADQSALPAAGAGVSVESILLFQIRLKHRVPGAIAEAPGLSLDATAEGGTVHFRMFVTNSGNTVLSYQAEPLAQLLLFNTSPWGDPNTPERTLQVDAFYVAPGSERVVAVVWPDAPLFGSYRAVVTLPGTDGLVSSSAETLFTTANWPALIAIAAVGVLLILLAALVLWWIWRGRKHARLSAGTRRAGRRATPAPELGAAG